MFYRYELWTDNGGIRFTSLRPKRFSLATVLKISTLMHARSTPEGLSKTQFTPNECDSSIVCDLFTSGEIKFFFCRFMYVRKSVPVFCICFISVAPFVIVHVPAKPTAGVSGSLHKECHFTCVLSCSISLGVTQP